jgi:hypothetical protein
LPEDVLCVNATAISIQANQTTAFTEYGSDLVLTANATGASTNANAFYTWYKDTEPVAVGKVFTVKAADLSTKWAGKYTVDVLTCPSGAGVVGNLTSAGETVVIHPKEGIVITSPVSPGANIPGNPQDFTFTVTAPSQPQVFLVLDTARIYSQSAVTNTSGNSYTVTVTVRPVINPGGANKELTLRMIDVQGNLSAPVTISRAPMTGTVAGSYILYAKPDDAPFLEAVNYCRSLTWNGSRATLLSMEVLNKNKAAFSANNNRLPAGNYWATDKTYTGPVLLTVSYSGGNVTFLPVTGGGVNETTNQRVRCLAPNN